MHKALLPGETVLMLFEQLQMFTTNAEQTNTMTGLCQNMESGLNHLTQHYKKLKGIVHPHPYDFLLVQNTKGDVFMGALFHTMKHNKRTIKVVHIRLLC